MKTTTHRPLLMLAGLCNAAWALAAESATIGVIEASLNGETRTWYIRGGGDVPGATVMKGGDGRYTAVIAGFENAQPDREPHGSQMTISFDFSEGDERVVHKLPGEGREAASLRLMPSTENVTVMHALKQGRVTVDQIVASNGRITGFKGTFSGILEGSEGEMPGELKDGSFRVDEVPAAEPD